MSKWMAQRCLFTAITCATFCIPSSRADEIPPQPVDGKIVWLYRYADGQELARETGKPMFVVFRCER